MSVSCKFFHRVGLFFSVSFFDKNILQSQKLSTHTFEGMSMQNEINSRNKWRHLARVKLCFTELFHVAVNYYCNPSFFSSISLELAFNWLPMNNNTPGIAMLRETFVFSTFRSQETFLVLLGRPVPFRKMKQIYPMICKLKTKSIITCINVSSVMEFLQWRVLTSKIFCQNQLT